MSKTNSICIFDTETIPDVLTLRAVFGYEGDDEEVMAQAFAAQKAKTGSEFLPPNFHKVVAISAVMADEFGRFERTSSIQATNEAELISKFISFINSKSPRLVSFNGRNFDLPMLMIRAMRYNLSCPAYFDTKSDGKDKWTHYRSRFDGVFHLDLCDHIAEFGAARGMGLDALCKSLNIPGKYDTHGDDVWRLWLAKEQDTIEQYCESDTLNTYWLFLKYELLRGLITPSDYGAYLSRMQASLHEKHQDKGYTEVFSQAIESELARLEGRLAYDQENTHQIGKSLPEIDIHEDLKQSDLSQSRLASEAYEDSPNARQDATARLAELGVSLGAGNLKNKKAQSEG